MGNRLTKTDSVSGVTTYTYNGLNQLDFLTANGVVTDYSYDNNGNLISEVTGNNSTVYRWANDGENRLMGVTVNEGGVSRDVGYEYNAKGIRVGKVVDGLSTRYLIDELQPYAQVLEEYDAVGNAKGSYVYGYDLLGKLEGSESEFYHADGLGSTRVLTNGLGAVTDSYSYDAFGNLIGGNGGSSNAYLFAGEQRDSETGLDYLRARYYDPFLGRFISADAYEGKLNDPLSLHDYLYAHANPVVNTDPSGYMSIINLMAGVAIVGILAGLSYTTYGAMETLGSGGSWQDAISMYDQYLAGFADIVTFGGSTEFRKWQYGKSAIANHRGVFFNLGRMAGSGASFAVGFAAPTNLAANINWAARAALGHTLLGTGLGAHQSAKNIASGNFTPFDFVAFLPLAGYLSQRIILPLVNSGKTTNWTSKLPAGSGETDYFGRMTLSQQGTQLDKDSVRIHEGVHSFLSPSQYSLGAKLSAKWKSYFYNNSFFFKYIEEVLAETVAQVATRKLSGISLSEAIKVGLTFPINNAAYAVRGKPMNFKNIGLEIIGFSTLLVPGLYGSYSLGTQIEEWNNE